MMSKFKSGLTGLNGVYGMNAGLVQLKPQFSLAIATSWNLFQENSVMRGRLGK
jgi:hypothetical protein